MTNLTPSHATTTSTRRASRLTQRGAANVFLTGAVVASLLFVIGSLFVARQNLKELVSADVGAPHKATSRESETAETEFLLEAVRKAEESPMIADAPSLTGLWRSDYDVSSFYDFVVRYDLNLKPGGTYTLSSLTYKKGLGDPYTDTVKGNYDIHTVKGNYDIRGHVLRLTPEPGDQARQASSPGRLTLAWEKPESRDSLIIGTIIPGGASKNRFVRQ